MNNFRDKDYSEFFKDDHSSSSKSENPSEEETTHETTKSSPAYYYSYGPFQPSSREQEKPEASSHLQSMENTSLQENDTTPTDSAVSGISKRKKFKKKSGLKSRFAAFMAGAVVVATLMFTADYMDMFTPDQAMSGSDSTYANMFDRNDGGEGSVDTAALLNDEDGRPDTIADIVDQAGPAVVKIETYINGNKRQGQAPNGIPEDFFNYFFGDQYRQPQANGDQKMPAGMGSGFIFEKSGYILTNQHVVANADEIYVTLKGSTEPYKAELLGSDYNLDLAVLKIEGDEDFPSLAIGDSSQLRVGEWVTAIGNPVGFDHTVSVGVISANEREISIPDSKGTRNYRHLLQTDASINPGNSGGPLLNMEGEVIGINTAVSKAAQGIGFAIPTTTIVDVLDKLKNNETIPRPFIGVWLNNVDERWQEELELDSTDGAIIVQVQRNAPAHRAGLQPGDVVIEVNGENIENVENLQNVIREMEVGDRANMVFIRDGKQVETTVTIIDQNELQQ